MADKSKIEWTDASWTPVRARCWEIQNDGSGKERIGWHCEHVSEGCRNCYAENINIRLGTGFEFKPGNLRGKPGYYGGGIDRPELFLDEKMLLAPLRWRKPRMIFVCSMTDLFADFVTDEWRDKMFAVMALCPQHRFQVLTKRADRMCAYFAGASEERMWQAQFVVQPGTGKYHVDWPLPNVWLGVSAERQQEADERIPLLLQTPAAVRFVSLEPLLGPINLKRVNQRVDEASGNEKWTDALHGVTTEWDHTRAGGWGGVAPAKLDWVIVGGESGRNARPMNPDWARSLRDQCQAAGVSFFFKQWGEWARHKVVPGGDLGGDVRAGRVRIVHPTGQSDVEVSIATSGRSTLPGSRYMERVGKKAAGRLLDGREHNGFPEARA